MTTENKLWGDVKNSASSSVDFIQDRIETFQEKHPGIWPTVKKIIPYAIGFFAFISNPIATTIGAVAGLLLKNQLSPIVNKVKEYVQNSFEDSNLLGKALIGLGVFGCFVVFPSWLTATAIGVDAGCKIGKCLSR